MNGRRWLALLLAMALLLCAGCSFRTKYGDTFRFPLEGEPRQLDPQMATDTASVTVLHALMEGLTSLGENGQPQPAVAESWQTADNVTWVFRLRDTTWSDGTPLTAADFVYAWKRAVDPATGSPVVQRFDNIASVAATDAHTLTVRLHTAEPDFARAVADTPFFPCNEAFFLSTQGHYGMDAEYVLSNGAFTLASWQHHAYVSMRKNEAYHAAAGVLPAAVRYVITAPDDPLVALEENNIDALELTTEQAVAAQKRGLPVITMTDSLCAMWFNTSLPMLADATVRTALRDSVEWELLTEALAVKGTAAGAVDFVPPDATANGDGYRERAGTVGYIATTNAAATLRAAELPALEVLCADDEDTLQVARLILQSWQKHADLYFTLRPLSEAELSARLAVGNYQIAIGTVSGYSGDARTLLSAYVSDGAENVTRLHDRELTTLLAAANSLEGLVACERRLHELCPCVPLWYAKRAYATGKDVEGVVIRPFGGNPYGAVYDFLNAEK